MRENVKREDDDLCGGSLAFYALRSTHHVLQESVLCPAAFSLPGVERNPVTGFVL